MAMKRAPKFHHPDLVQMTPKRVPKRVSKWATKWVTKIHHPSSSFSKRRTHDMVPPGTLNTG